MIKLKVDDCEVFIELFEDQAQKSVAGIRELLPLKAHAVHCKFAGYEVMIPIPVVLEKENQVEKVGAGDVGYYVDNGILCLFYGKIYPFAAVNLVGKVSWGLDDLKKIGATLLNHGPQPVYLKALSKTHLG
ncbi:MAG: cyclophilin-like fold protein [Desulfobacterales bacterium]|jgi:hypothetical protein